MIAGPNRSPGSPPAKSPTAFTLVELLVSMVILLMLAGIVFSLTDATSKIWKNTSNKIDAFQSARYGFESMTRNLSQATLNTYWDYFDSKNVVVNGTNAFDHYGRNSELHFISGTASKLITAPSTWSAETTGTSSRPTHAVFFIAPAGYTAPPTGSGVNSFQGLDRLLNACGYYIEYNSDANNRPAFLGANAANRQYRFRLMQVTQPSDRLTIYSKDANHAVTAGFPKYNAWFNDALKIPPQGTPSSATATANRPDAQPIADNIIALFIQPKRSTTEAKDAYGAALLPVAPEYSYDSRYIPLASGLSTLYTAATTEPTRMLARNQLPPFIQVTMVALDETSAIRLGNNPAPPDLITPSGAKFVDSTQFSAEDASTGGAKDLEKLVAYLSSKRLIYRVFTTNVVIKGAKWSEK